MLPNNFKETRSLASVVWEVYLPNYVTHLVLVLGELVPELLHLLEEGLALVQLELGLREVLVQTVLAHLHPVLAHLRRSK